MKKNILTFLKYFLILPVFLFAPACKKGFLDAKPNSSIVTPKTLDDLEGLLKNNLITQSTPGLSQMACDDYVFAGYNEWQSANTVERNSYIWSKDIFQGANNVWAWSYPYLGAFYSNNALEGLDKIEMTPANSSQYKQIKGWAYFVRAFMFYDLARHFSPVYNAATAHTDLGIPLKLRTEIDEVVPRSSLQQTYDQIFIDINRAIPLLNNLPESKRNRPSKVSAYALASRISLSMRNYPKAEAYADSTLRLYNNLIDYNTVDTVTETPFLIDNQEVLYSATTPGIYFEINGKTTTNTSVIPNPDIVSSYQQFDLRKPIFFITNPIGQLSMKHGYEGLFSAYPFSGLALDEIYLIKAECLARRGEIIQSMTWLNNLLIKRFSTGNFVPVSAANAAEALLIVLGERRKELIWRTLRWDDLKRLNLEGANITLTRVLNGQTYSIAPNDSRYVFPIPDDEIALSGIQQNKR
ncbi:SusD family protein [Pedobacter westerhofensis]|uniref:SusD family protein n=1 Tax=Pedobacter westerhofensis TaxID=425512 RepID=A0A521EEG8_9SPHI|nr:RagB/SusD family nutrient uptake outer membrane protein [Pedobacter westerhofensis]SMO82314.1 SusD family protein [Pedobacter westerhofensis]